MKKWAIILVFGLWGCDDSEDEFGAPDQILLLSDREVVCPGQTANFRLFSTFSKTEIPISEFTFDPLPAGIGTLNPAGLFTASSEVEATELSVSGIFRSDTKIIKRISLKPQSNASPGALLRLPLAFFDREKVSLVHSWPDGSMIFSIVSDKFLFGYNKIESFEKKEIFKYSSDGKIEWRKSFDRDSFVELKKDKIYVAGLNNVGNASFFSVEILDLNGQKIWSMDIPETLKQGLSVFGVDIEGNLYFSNSNLEGNKYKTFITKVNSEGKNCGRKKTLIFM